MSINNRQTLSTEEAKIEAVGINKSYRNGSMTTPVLNDVSLSVLSGEFVFLLGPSGSGKSTLLSILGCVLSADAGHLEVLGQNVSKCSAKHLTEFRRNHLGFVFQRFHLFPGLTALENVRVPLDLRGVAKKVSSSQAKELLCAVGLAEKLDSDIRELSMGQRQRVAVARALIGDPDILFADEPTASLDVESGKATVELLRQLAKERHKTVVVVTHDTRILEYADRILHLEGGRLRDNAASAPTPPLPLSVKPLDKTLPSAMPVYER